MWLACCCVCKCVQRKCAEEVHCRVALKRPGPRSLPNDPLNRVPNNCLRLCMFRCLVGTDTLLASCTAVHGASCVQVCVSQALRQSVAGGGGGPSSSTGTICAEWLHHLHDSWLNRGRLATVAIALQSPVSTSKMEGWGLSQRITQGGCLHSGCLHSGCLHTRCATWHSCPCAHQCKHNMGCLDGPLAASRCSD